MYASPLNLQRTGNWLGYLGLLPFLAGVVLLLVTSNTVQVLDEMRNYAAIILTFVGAIHWGRAMSNGNRILMGLSVIPSVFAWSTLSMPLNIAIPSLMVAFLLLWLFDYQSYQQTPWFRSLRTLLTFSVCFMLGLGWFMT